MINTNINTNYKLYLNKLPFSVDEPLDFQVDGKKISGWFESISDNIITLRVFKDEYSNLEMNDFMKIHIDYLFNEFEERLKSGYQEYLKLPKATVSNVHESELYQNGWCVKTGLGVVDPDPHKYYTFLEFVFHCGKNEKLFNRFIK